MKALKEEMRFAVFGKDFGRTDLAILGKASKEGGRARRRRRRRRRGRGKKQE